jgi:hypothetical protein
MKKMQLAVLAALGIALVFTSGCHQGNVAPQGPVRGHGEGPGPNQHFGKSASREFQVYIYTPDPNNTGQCSIDWPVATLWKSANQTVTWFSDDNNQYTVDFTQPGSQGSPFSSTWFTVPKGGSVNSGSIQSNAGYYSFVVHAGDLKGQICKKATDPDPGYYVK